MLREGNLIKIYSNSLAEEFLKEDFKGVYSVYKFKILEAILNLLEVINPLNISSDFKKFIENLFQ
jgi:hypothetical protein